MMQNKHLSSAIHTAGPSPYNCKSVTLAQHMQLATLQRMRDHRAALRQPPGRSAQHLRLCRDLVGEGPGAMSGTMRQAAASIEDKARRHRRQQYLCIRGSSALNSLSHTEAFKLSVVR